MQPDMKFFWNSRQLKSFATNWGVGGISMGYTIEYIVNAIQIGCFCVWNFWPVKPLLQSFFSARASGNPSMSSGNSTCNFPIFPTWEEAQPKNLPADFSELQAELLQSAHAYFGWFHLPCTVYQRWYFLSGQQSFLVSGQVYWAVFARKMHSTFTIR